MFFLCWQKVYELIILQYTVITYLNLSIMSLFFIDTNIIQKETHTHRHPKFKYPKN